MRCEQILEVVRDGQTLYKTKVDTADADLDPAEPREMLITEGEGGTGGGRT